MSEKPCIHAEPQAASQLHGVCIFCYRDRLAETKKRLASAESVLIEHKRDYGDIAKQIKALFAEIEKWLDGHLAQSILLGKAREALEYAIENLDLPESEYAKTECEAIRRMKEALALFSTPEKAAGEDDATVFFRAVFDYLGMRHEQRTYGWHEVHDALSEGLKKVRALRGAGKNNGD